MESSLYLQDYRGAWWFVDNRVMIEAAPDALRSTPRPAAPEVVKTHGKGWVNSPPFHLSGGNYAVEWTLPSSGCTIGSGWLKQVPTGFPSEHIFESDIMAGESSSGTGFAYGVEPATYYVKATGDCDWYAEFVRL